MLKQVVKYERGHTYMYNILTFILSCNDPEKSTMKVNFRFNSMPDSY